MFIFHIYRIPAHERACTIFEDTVTFRKQVHALILEHKKFQETRHEFTFEYEMILAPYRNVYEIDLKIQSYLFCTNNAID